MKPLKVVLYTQKLTYLTYYKNRIKFKFLTLYFILFFVSNFSNNYESLKYIKPLSGLLNNILPLFQNSVINILSG